MPAVGWLRSGGLRGSGLTNEPADTAFGCLANDASVRSSGAPAQERDLNLQPGELDEVFNYQDPYEVEVTYDAVGTKYRTVRQSVQHGKYLSAFRLDQKGDWVEFL